ncbi:MAG TPA: DNA recombination protein RmuC [Pseudomonadales bacterium]|nr:DNA recombination protein RmuC [Pseudomonadales bacterium]
MPIEIIIASLTFVLGAILSGLAVHMRHRVSMRRLQQAREVNEAVINAGLEARQRDIENLNYRIQEAHERLANREDALQRAVVAEATLGTQVETLRGQLEALESRLAAAAQANDELRGDNTRYREKISHLETTLAEQQKQSVEKLELLEQARQRLNTEFKNLANEIFESKQRVFTERSQAQLDGLLKPLSERIKDFEKRVEETYSAESKERFSLIKEVKNLQDLNARISQDAVNLTNALKGENKTQGTWGEMILERVLEKSGLTRGREYEVQVSLKDDDGRRLQPDVVVHLPEEKDVIVDSKVSLVAYERYCAAETDDERGEALKAHIQSVRQHIRLLGDKEYQGLKSLRTLDFVLLFIPVEAAFGVAVQQDGELFGDAFDRNIMVVSPSTLLATLRMIHNIWRFEQQNKNAQEIARRAGALYDKFAGFVADLEEIGTRLASVQNSYDKAHNKLVSGRGNLVTRAEGMRELGAKVSKSLPENLVEMPVRDSSRSQSAN